MGYRRGFRGSRPGNEIPVVRHLIPCDNIVVSATVQNVSIGNLVYVIRVLAGNPYPRIHPLLCLFALLTNGRGPHKFRVVIVQGVGPNERVVYAGPEFDRDLGSDPLSVHGLPMRLRNVPFPRPGQYEVRLLCDGEILAGQPIELR
jgi:hypothetical protein